MIPPGIHFIYFSVTDKYGSVGLRTGFFHDFKLGEIVAKRWSAAAESVDLQHAYTPAEMEAFICNKKSLDKFLGAYPFDEYKRWLSLTNQITSALVKRLMPPCGLISSGSTLIGKPFTMSSARRVGNAPTTTTTTTTTTAESTNEADASAKFEAKQELLVNTDVLKRPASLRDAEQMLPHMERDESASIRFSDVLALSLYPAESTPAEITRCSIDQSHRLEQLMSSLARRGDELLGEIQFAFVCFLVAQVYDAFEQWKRLVSLMCNSERSVCEHTSVYASLVQLLHAELTEMPEDFFAEFNVEPGESFLALHLHNLFDNVAATDAARNTRETNVLHARCTQLKRHLEAKFHLSFDQEPDEYEPVVVALSDDLIETMMR